jgi:tight adherence protein C
MFAVLATLASLSAGSAVGCCVYYILEYLSGLRLEKHFRTRLEGMSEFEKRGLAGNLLFFADKLGQKLKKSKISYLKVMTEKNAYYLSVLGKPFNKFDAYSYAGIQVISGVSAAIFASILFGPLNILMLLSLAAAGFFAPFGYLHEKVKKAHREITRQLPDLLDLLTLMAGSGLDLGAALEKAALLGEGFLFRELSFALREIELGRPRTEALSVMADRLKHAQLSSFVKTLVCAFRTGGNLLADLKSLSEQFKTIQLQTAEKAAGEAPLKLMLPLIIFIFPTVFIILFGPIILAFTR